MMLFANSNTSIEITLGHDTHLALHVVDSRGQDAGARHHVGRSNGSHLGAFNDLGLGHRVVSLVGNNLGGCRESCKLALNFITVSDNDV